MKIPPKLVNAVEKIEIWIEHGESTSTLAIKGVGTVGSTGFTDALLEYVETGNEPPFPHIHPHDFYEFEFYATPPQVGDMYSMVETPIETVFKWEGYSANMKCIRLIAASGHKDLLVELGGPGTGKDTDDSLPVDTDLEA